MQSNLATMKSVEVRISSLCLVFALKVDMKITVHKMANKSAVQYTIAMLKCTTVRFCFCFFCLTERCSNCELTGIFMHTPYMGHRNSRFFSPDCLMLVNMPPIFDAKKMQPLGIHDRAHTTPFACKQLLSLIIKPPASLSMPPVILSPWAGGYLTCKRQKHMLVRNGDR